MLRSLAKSASSAHSQPATHWFAPKPKLQALDKIATRYALLQQVTQRADTCSSASKDRDCCAQDQSSIKVLTCSRNIYNLTSQRCTSRPAQTITSFSCFSSASTRRCVASSLPRLYPTIRVPHRFICRPCRTLPGRSNPSSHHKSSHVGDVPSHSLGWRRMILLLLSQGQCGQPSNSWDLALEHLRGLECSASGRHNSLVRDMALSLFIQTIQLQFAHEQTVQNFAEFWQNQNPSLDYASSVIVDVHRGNRNRAGRAVVIARCSTIIKKSSFFS